jgi:hypothetical protein
MGNINSKVLRCDVVGDTATFVKEAALDPAGPSRYFPSQSGNMIWAV